MLIRGLFGLPSSARSTRFSAKRATSQVPFFLSSRCASASASRPNPSKDAAVSTEKPSITGSAFPKFVIGTIVIGAAVGTAYQAGYIGKLQVKHENLSHKSSKLDALDDSSFKEQYPDQPSFPSKETSNEKPPFEAVGKTEEHCQVDDMNATEVEASNVEVTRKELSNNIEEESPQKKTELSNISEDVSSPEKEHAASDALSLSDIEVDKALEVNSDSTEVTEQNEITTTSVSPTDDIETEKIPSVHLALDEAPEGTLEHEMEAPRSLSEVYSLQEDEDKRDDPFHNENVSISAPSLEDKEIPIGKLKEFVATKESKDQKIVIDFIEAIHTAEKRQAESDFRAFSEEMQKLKEMYEKELKDAKARELMYAEEAAILDKELSKERLKAISTAKMLHEKAEEKLKIELQHKEEEMELKLKELKELGKAELNAAIAKEKSSHMEKMSEANLHIKALCMAFYARSEEARQSYSIHKLALGSLALEDALSKGLPIKEEIDALHSSLVGLDKDSFLDLVLATLPEETLNNGTVALPQLSQKFNTLKGTLRHFSLIPQGGGGILTHSLAQIASSIKMSETNASGNGIESVITTVDNFLVEGKLAEAATALEQGVSGTEAEGAVRDWVKCARNRAVTEQALTLLQAYATSISLN